MSNPPQLKPVSFNSGEVFRSSFPQRFRPKQGEAYRLFLPEIDCAFQARVHYLQPNYTFCLAENGIGKDCPACQNNLYPTWRYGMNVVLYKTDNSANLVPATKEVDGKQVKGFDWDVRLWLFAQTVANELHNIRTNWDLMTHDIKLLCQSERPQKYSIQACPDSVFASRKDLQSLIVTAIKNGRRDPVKELAVMATADEMAQAIASGAGKKDRKPVGGSFGQPAFGGNQGQPNFPQANQQNAAFNSPGVISPNEGHSSADASLSQGMVAPQAQIQPTGTEVREVSNDSEFDELLNNIRNQGK